MSDREKLDNLNRRERMIRRLGKRFQFRDSENKKIQDRLHQIQRERIQLVEGCIR